LVKDHVYRLVMKLGMRSFSAAWLLAAAVCVAQLPAKSAANTDTLTVDARLVNVPVVVQDKKGALVQNLSKENFLLQVDGNPQLIRYFNIDRDLPLTLGLLVDTSMSQRDVIDEEQKASSAFLDDMLNGPADRDKAFVIQFARSTELLQDITSSKPKLQAALKQLDTPGSGRQANPSPDTDSNNNGRVGRMRGVGTTLYDALFLSSDELMKKQKGRKALIILSDGVDFGSKESLVGSIEAAQRSDSIVYAIYFKGKERPGQQRDGGGGGRRGGGFPGGRGGGGGGWPGSGGGGRGGQGRGGQGGGAGRGTPVDGKKILQRMVDDTGGRFFEVSKKETVADIYKQIGEELRAQYRLAFTPDSATASAGITGST